jgi:hypothetical protein
VRACASGRRPRHVRLLQASDDLRQVCLLRFEAVVHHAGHERLCGCGVAGRRQPGRGREPAPPQERNTGTSVAAFPFPEAGRGSITELPARDESGSSGAGRAFRRLPAPHRLAGGLSESGSGPYPCGTSLAAASTEGGREMAGFPVDRTEASAGPLRAGPGGTLDVDSEREYWRKTHKKRTYYRRGTPFEDYEPAYRHGWESAIRPELRGLSFEESEPDLRDRWERSPLAARRSWTKVRDEVRDAWLRVRIRRPGSTF